MARARTKEQATKERLGKCCNELCSEPAACRNCARCEFHHQELEDDHKGCGFEAPKGFTVDDRGFTLDELSGVDNA